jgi:hypothetical protein
MAFLLSSGTQSFGQLVGANVLEIAVVILTPLLVLLVRRLLKLIEDKTKLDIAGHYEVVIDDLVHRGIAYAEQQAKNALKADKPLKSEDKKSLAVNMVMQQIKNFGLAEMASDRIAELVEAHLFDEKKAEQEKAVGTSK